MFCIFLAALAGASGFEKPPQYNQEALLELARQTVIAQVRHLEPPKPVEKDPPLGVFVTIESKGRILGCRGTLQPKTRSLQEELVSAAKSASLHDPRYKPVTVAALEDFQVTVTIVERLTNISTVAGLQPQDGLVLKAGSKTGVVLPWEGKDPKIRLQWAYKKAGIPLGSSAVLQRMKATRFKG